jgi:pyruvate carboxylase subunit B
VKYIVSIEGREIPVEVDGREVRVDGQTFEAHLTPVPGTPLRHLLSGNDSLTLAMSRLEPGRWEAQFRGSRFSMEVVDERTRHIRSLTGGAARADTSLQLKAPMPGLVVRVLVEPGQQVQAGQGLIVLEAMKMENELKARTGAKIRAVSASPGQAVEKGQVLVEFEPAQAS